MRILPLLLCPLLQTQAAEFWNGAVQYDPPLVMFSDPIIDTSGHTNGWEFNTAAPSTNGVAKVEFRLEDMSTFLGREALRPIRTIGDLRSFCEEKMRSGGTSPYYSGTLTKLDGREALVYTSRTNHIPNARRPDSWSYGACLFWQQKAEWQRSALLEIMIETEKSETLTMITNSLQTLKIWPGKWGPQ